MVNKCRTYKKYIRCVKIREDVVSDRRDVAAVPNGQADAGSRGHLKVLDSTDYGVEGQLTSGAEGRALAGASCNQFSVNQWLW